MSTPGRDERIYAALLALGIALPYAHAVPWLARHGLDLRRFGSDVFGTEMGRFFGYDVLVSCGALLVLASLDDELSAAQRAGVGLGTLAGSSVGLPLYLYLRARNRRLN